MDGKIPKQRDIYSNYDLWEKYPDEEIKSILIEEEKYETEDEISDYISDKTGFCHYGFDLEDE